MRLCAFHNFIITVAAASFFGSIVVTLAALLYSGDFSSWGIVGVSVWLVSFVITLLVALIMSGVIRKLRKYETGIFILLCLLGGGVANIFIGLITGGVDVFLPDILLSTMIIGCLYGFCFGFVDTVIQRQDDDPLKLKWQQILIAVPAMFSAITLAILANILVMLAGKGPGLLPIPVYEALIAAIPLFGLYIMCSKFLKKPMAMVCGGVSLVSGAWSLITGGLQFLLYDQFIPDTDRYIMPNLPSVVLSITISLALIGLGIWTGCYRSLAKPTGSQMDTPGERLESHLTN